MKDSQRKAMYAKKNGGVSSKDTRTRKAIQTEIWKAKGENVFV